MRYLVVLTSLFIAELVRAGSNVDIGSTVSIAIRSHILQARGDGEKKQKALSSPVRSASPPVRVSSSQAQSASNSSGRKSKLPSPVEHGSAQSPPERASKSPRLSAHATSPQGTRRNASPSSPTRKTAESASRPIGDRPASASAAADLPRAPTSIRTNPASQSRRGQQSPELPAAAQQRQPRLAEPLAREQFQQAQLRQAQFQRVLQDPTIAKASATLQAGQGSVMTSRVPRHGPSHLTVDNVLGSRVKTVVSPYHTYVMATNNLQSGSMSAKASGDSIVKGRIDSMDVNGSGTIRAQVPGRSETKATISGIGHVELEATNHHPTAGHARIQADYTGYGFVEAQAAQNGWSHGTRQDQAQVPHPPRPDRMPQNPRQPARGGPSASGIRRNSGEPDLDSAEAGQSRRRGQGPSRSA